MHALCEAQNSMQKRCQRDWKDHELRPRPCLDDGVDARTWEVRAVRSQVDTAFYRMRSKCEQCGFFCYAGRAVLACWLVLLVILHAEGACVRCVHIVQRITHCETTCGAAVPAHRAGACPSACPVAAGVAVQWPAEH